MSISTVSLNLIFYDGAALESWNTSSNNDGLIMLYIKLDSSYEDDGTAYYI